MTYTDFQNKINYHFKNIDLLDQATRHSSFCNEQQIGMLADNERLEFLGDSVLELVSSEFLYKEYPDVHEGELTKMRASKVCEPALAFCARKLELETMIQLGRGEEACGGRGRDSLVSDALESLIGAIYLDGGFASAKEFIDSFIMIDLNKDLFRDSKTILQEITQKEFRKDPEYRLVKMEGPDHDRMFTMEVLVGDKIYGTGKGRSKKLAQQQAASEALKVLTK